MTEDFLSDYERRLANEESWFIAISALGWLAFGVGLVYLGPYIS